MSFKLPSVAGCTYAGGTPQRFKSYGRRALGLRRGVVKRPRGVLPRYAALLGPSLMRCTSPHSEHPLHTSVAVRSSDTTYIVTVHSAPQPSNEVTAGNEEGLYPCSSREVNTRGPTIYKTIQRTQYSSIIDYILNHPI